MNIDLLNQSPADDDSVRHLAELGYIDPLAVAAREAAVRRQLDVELHQAVQQFERGELEAASQQFERLAAEDPSWIAPRQLLAESCYRMGELDRAQSVLDQLTVQGVERPRLALLGGAIALARRDMTAALDLLEYAVYVQPSLPSVHTLLGTVLFRLGKLPEADAAFERAIAARPTDATAFDGLAAIRLRTKDFAAAADLALQALDHDMQLFRAHYHLGVALMNLERPQEAATAFETAAKLNASSAVPYYWLARIAAELLGKSDLATQYDERGRDVIRRRREDADRGHGRNVT